MPMARISLLAGKSASYVRAVSDGVHRALVEAFDVPPDDRFQVIHQHAREELVFDTHYGGGPRSDAFVLVCITAGRPRTAATKQAFYRRLTEVLAAAPGIDPRDVMVVVNTTGLDDWSFSGGIVATFPRQEATA